MKTVSILNHTTVQNKEHESKFCMLLTSTKPMVTSRLQSQGFSKSIRCGKSATIIQNNLDYRALCSATSESSHSCTILHLSKLVFLLNPKTI